MGWHRVLVAGGSATGTTTLGRSLAMLKAVPHADVDDYLWLPTSPAFTHKRPVPERLALMNAVFVPRDSWVLSGTLRGWGDSIIEKVEAVVFLTLDPLTRMERLASREVVRCGDAIEPGGSGEEAYLAFAQWARAYDDTALADSRRARDEGWLARLSCPILRLDSAKPVSELVTEVDRWLGNDLGADGHRA